MTTKTQKKIGVLALQGAFAKHKAMLERLGASVILVRTPEDLLKCDGLIIPGGESTTIYRQMNFIELIAPLLKFAEKKPVFGTCAGLILISKDLINGSLTQPLGLIDVTVERNSYGRQIDSFQTELEVLLSKTSRSVTAFFIRAPRIRRCGSDVKVLATYSSEPVLVQQGFHLGSTFHPELTSDTLIHEYFLALVDSNKGPHAPLRAECRSTEAPQVE